MMRSPRSGTSIGDTRSCRFVSGDKVAGGLTREADPAVRIFGETALTRGALVGKGRLVMATGAAPPAEEQGRVHARRSFVLLLLGPAVLLLGSALVIGGLFLPWYHADAYLVGDPYPFQPVVPMQSFDGSDWYWLILAAIPIMATLVCLGIDATPRLRRPGLIRGAAFFFHDLTLVAGGVGSILLILFHLASPDRTVMDSGYVVSVAGYLLLVPGAILLRIGQTQVSQLVRLGRLRAP